MGRDKNKMLRARAECIKLDGKEEARETEGEGAKEKPCITVSAAQQVYAFCYVGCRPVAARRG